MKDEKLEIKYETRSLTVLVGLVFTIVWDGGFARHSRL